MRKGEGGLEKRLTDARLRVAKGHGSDFWRGGGGRKGCTLANDESCIFVAVSSRAQRATTRVSLNVGEHSARALSAGDTRTYGRTNERQ